MLDEPMEIRPDAPPRRCPGRPRPRGCPRLAGTARPMACACAERRSRPDRADTAFRRAARGRQKADRSFVTQADTPIERLIRAARSRMPSRTTAWWARSTASSRRKRLALVHRPDRRHAQLHARHPRVRHAPGAGARRRAGARRGQRPPWARAGAPGAGGGAWETSCVTGTWDRYRRGARPAPHRAFPRWIGSRTPSCCTRRRSTLPQARTLPGFEPSHPRGLARAWVR